MEVENIIKEGLMKENEFDEKKMKELKNEIDENINDEKEMIKEVIEFDELNDYNINNNNNNNNEIEEKNEEKNEENFEKKIIKIIKEQKKEITIEKFIQIFKEQIQTQSKYKIDEEIKSFLNITKNEKEYYFINNYNDKRFNKKEKEKKETFKLFFKNAGLETNRDDLVDIFKKHFDGFINIDIIVNRKNNCSRGFFLFLLFRERFYFFQIIGRF
jgi:hypothetical protein